MEETKTDKEGNAKTEPGEMRHKTRNADSHLRLKEAKEDPSPEPSEGVGPC